MDSLQLWNSPKYGRHPSLAEESCAGRKSLGKGSSTERRQSTAFQYGSSFSGDFCGCALAGSTELGTTARFKSKFVSLAEKAKKSSCACKTLDKKKN